MKTNKDILTSTLPGFMELLPNEQMVFNDMLETIKSSYELFGFIPLDTPVLERSETLLAKAGGETEKQIYRFKKGSTDMAMRFDLTVPLARYVANNQRNLVFPFKRYAIGKVYRGERPQAGRLREFYQCDIDVIGDEVLDINYDAEIPATIYNIFKKLDFGKFTIKINNRRILNGLFDSLNIADKSKSVMQTIDKLDKIGLGAVEKGLSKLVVSKDSTDILMKFVQTKGTSEEIIEKLLKLKIKNEKFKTGMEELSQVIKKAREFGLPKKYIQIDLSIARGLDYYTGTVYETFLDKYPEIGSICSGGRYDNLASTYTYKKLPGVGISIGLSRLFNQLYKKGLIKMGASTPTKILVISIDDKQEVAYKFTQLLRQNKISTEFSYSNDKLKKQIKYADKLGIPYIVLIGEKETNENLYTLKNMRSGKQQLLPVNEVINQILNQK